MISQKIIEIRVNIEQICAKIGRNPNDILLIGVTKYTDVVSIKLAVRAGLTDIAESRVQDARQKFSELEESGLDFKRHMIGHLQTNKVKDAVSMFDIIQSVDSEKVAVEIDRQAAKIGKVLDVLVQVNSSNEEQKFGVASDQALDLIKKISILPNIKVLGLMTIGLLADDREKVAKCFRATKDLFDQTKKELLGLERVDMKYLSMGMTQDYEVAIECGANMVRIGSGIFN